MLYRVNVFYSKANNGTYQFHTLRAVTSSRLTETKVRHHRGDSDSGVHFHLNALQQKSIFIEMWNISMIKTLFTTPPAPWRCYCCQWALNTGISWNIGNGQIVMWELSTLIHYSTVCEVCHKIPSWIKPHKNVIINDIFRE